MKTPCLVCKKPKDHNNNNNSFCSAKCCKHYNEEIKSVRMFKKMQAKLEKIQRHRLTVCF